MPSFFARKEKRLGVAREKRRYDLPLGKAGGGSGFLVLLIALMTFLMMLALCASFALSALASRWTAGLENQATVEIPAKRENGDVLTQEEIAKIMAQAESFLSADSAIADARAMSREEIADLVRPWLGEGLLPGDIPLPGLLSVTMKDTSPETIRRLETGLKSLHGTARIDTHREWLADLLRMAGALNLFALSLVLVIGATTAVAVAGAMQSRMAVHYAEIELLHLMGAHDRYIAGQFQRYALSLAFRGAFWGVLAGAASLFLASWLSGGGQASLLPGYKIGYGQMTAFAAIPLVMALISFAAARRTILNDLSGMP